MNKYKYVYLLTLLCLVIAACNDEHNDEPPPPPAETFFWDASHVTFAGLSGPVRKVVETTYSLMEGENGEETVTFQMEFDAAGRLVYYNPNGMEPPTRDVWQTLAYYSYRYDEKGRMIEATVTPLGGEPVVYDLKYGDHTTYVPLIFPLGPHDFFLVKGLESITVADGSISYEFDGTKAVYKKEGAWTGDVITEYLYQENNPCPIQRIETTSRGSKVLSVRITGYTYDPQGRLLAQDTKLVENEVESERTIIRYADTQYLLPVSRKTDFGGSFLMDWLYTYDFENRLLRIDYIENKGAADEVSAHEKYTYLSTDGYGNWTDSRQEQSSLVNWDHADQLIGVRRTFSY